LVEIKPSASAGEVKASIDAALRRSAELDAGRVKVEADGDKVTLRGSVRS
jgi:osmotically-inducible protein OsmY